MLKCHPTLARKGGDREGSFPGRLRAPSQPRCRLLSGYLSWQCPGFGLHGDTREICCLNLPFWSHAHLQVRPICLLLLMWSQRPRVVVYCPVIKIGQLLHGWLFSHWGPCRDLAALPTPPQVVLVFIYLILDDSNQPAMALCQTAAAEIPAAWPSRKESPLHFLAAEAFSNGWTAMKRWHIFKWPKRVSNIFY